MTGTGATIKRGLRVITRLTTRSLCFQATTATITGAGNRRRGFQRYADLCANATATVNGSAAAINAANGDVLTVSNNTINVAAGAAITLTGTGNTVNAGSGNTVTLSAMLPT